MILYIFLPLIHLIFAHTICFSNLFQEDEKKRKQEEEERKRREEVCFLLLLRFSFFSFFSFPSISGRGLILFALQEEKKRLVEGDGDDGDDDLMDGIEEQHKRTHPAHALCANTTTLS